MVCMKLGEINTTFWIKLVQSHYNILIKQQGALVYFGCEWQSIWPKVGGVFCNRCWILHVSVLDGAVSLSLICMPLAPWVGLWPWLTTWDGEEFPWAFFCIIMDIAWAFWKAWDDVQLIMTCLCKFDQLNFLHFVIVIQFFVLHFIWRWFHNLRLIWLKLLWQW
jgi:hypothetical protein